MKLWGQVRQGAAKVAFEADKMVRIRKQETAISEAQREIKTVTAALGDEVLTLFNSGALSHPAIAAVNQKVAGLNVQMKELQASIEMIKAEEFQAGLTGQDATEAASSGAPIAPVAPVAPETPPPPAAPAAPISPVASSEPPTEE